MVSTLSCSPCGYILAQFYCWCCRVWAYWVEFVPCMCVAGLYTSTCMHVCSLCNMGAITFGNDLPKFLKVPRLILCLPCVYFSCQSASSVPCLHCTCSIVGNSISVESSWLYMMMGHWQIGIMVFCCLLLLQDQQERRDQQRKEQQAAKRETRKHQQDLIKQGKKPFYLKKSTWLSHALLCRILI